MLIRCISLILNLSHFIRHLALSKFLEKRFNLKTKQIQNILTNVFKLLQYKSLHVAIIVLKHFDEYTLDFGQLAYYLSIKTS